MGLTFPQLDLLQGVFREYQLSILPIRQIVPSMPAHNLIPISIHVHIPHRTLSTERPSRVRIRAVT